MKLDLYDPLTYENLMMGLIVHFERQNLIPLDAESIENILGPGIYSLYYSGDLDVYSSIKGKNEPIYVGKAVPPGSRKGKPLNLDQPMLRRRITEHSRSIGQTVNLDPSDFSFRVLAVVPVWITLAERFLIDHYLPVWNRCLEGFGDHDPGRGRYQGERSWWDTLHPGRSWADKLRKVKSRGSAVSLVQDFFSGQVPS